jgi:hypothetical protein
MNGVPATVVEDLIAVDRLFKCAILLDGGFATKRLHTQLIAVCIVQPINDPRHLFAARCVEGGWTFPQRRTCFGGSESISLA